MSIFEKGTDLGPHALAAGFFGAAAGGVIRWITLQESWRTGLCTLVASALFGGLVAPLFAPSVALSMDSPVLITTAFLSMVLGVVGLTVSKITIEILKTDTFIAFAGAFFTSVSTAWLAKKGVVVPTPSPTAPPAPALPPPSAEEEGAQP